MSQTFLAAAIQTVSGIDVAENLAAATRLVGQAAAQGAQLVVLPEYFGLMGQRDTDKIMQRESQGEGPMQKMLSALAKEHGIWLAGGSVPLECPDPARAYNSMLLYGPDGQLTSRYDKIHLFDFSGLGERYHESDTIYPGAQPVTCDTPLAHLALGVCYDLRFPELFRRMLPFDILLLPAAFTAVTGAAHWEVLVRARAIENQCYVIAAAQGGEHQNGRKTHGHSMIVDPWGKILGELPQGEGVVVSEIDLAYLHSVRTHLPALEHRLL